MKTIQRSKWNKLHEDFKGFHHATGQAYMLEIDKETGATVSVPVKIVSDYKKRPFIDRLEQHKLNSIHFI